MFEDLHLCLHLVPVSIAVVAYGLVLISLTVTSTIYTGGLSLLYSLIPLVSCGS